MTDARCPTCGQDTAAKQKPADRPRADANLDVHFCVKCGENWIPGVGLYRNGTVRPFADSLDSWL